MARNQASWVKYTLLLVAIVSLLLALAPAVARADLIDPETGEYGGGHVVEPDPELQIDPELAPEPDPEDTDGLPLLPLGVGTIVLAAGATAAIVCLNRRPTA